MKFFTRNLIISTASVPKATESSHSSKYMILGDDGIVRYATASTHGSMIYVSKSGDDASAAKGNPSMPWRNIWAAKDAASSGDTICVLAGTWVYDNRDSAGNPYNGFINSRVNLWKNGVTYYFSPGAKIEFYNQTNTGNDMYLFRPTGGSYETCTVLGRLEYTQYSTGPDTNYGASSYFIGSPISTDYGYEFYSETKSIISYCNQIVEYDRTTSLTNTTKVDIVSDYEEVTYLDGQSGSGAAYRIKHAGTDRLEFRSSVRKRRYAKSYAHYYTTNSNARVEICSQEIYIVGGSNGGTYMPQTGVLESGGLFLIHGSTGGQVNVYSDVIYYCTARINWYFGAIVTSVGGGGWSMNIKADLIDTMPNSHSTGMFYIISSTCSINFEGNIVTNTNDKQNGSWIWAGNDNNGLYSGTVPAGRFIAYTNGSGNVININGNIDFIGIETTKNSLFQPNGGSVINYTGKIRGNFAGTLAKTFNGTVNILDSYAISATGSSDAKLAKNGSAYTGTFRMSNSYIQLKNDSDTMCDGSNLKAIVSNSVAINSGTASVFRNSGSGSLQLLGSTVITAGASSIEYSGASSVIAHSTAASATFSISSLYGTMSVIPDLIY